MPTDRCLLFVDDEPNILRALLRLFRREGYTIFTAEGGKEGLKILEKEPISVIISDQRMPEMTGVEFLSQVKELYPDTIRIVLSGYTDLDSVTDAINRGAIYKFLTKPWDDDLLKKNIVEAFTYHEMMAENIRLTEELQAANTELGLKVDHTTHQLQINTLTLETVRLIFENLPLAIVGIDCAGTVVVTNQKAHELLNSHLQIGLPAAMCLPEEIVTWYEQHQGEEVSNSRIQLTGGSELNASLSNFSKDDQELGQILILS